MSETFAQYLEKWLKLSTAQGLNNPLVKMPIKRFRFLQSDEFVSIANGGSLIIGTISDPVVRNLYKNYQTRIRERGEHCAFICSGVIEMSIAGSVGQQKRTALFPVCLKRASLHMTTDNFKVIVADEESWLFNPVLKVHLRDFNINYTYDSLDDPEQVINWLKAQLGNRASQIKSDSYVGLFSSQQMVVQERLTEPSLRQALARNPVVQAKIEGRIVEPVILGEITDDGIEELGLVLPCDDSQLRVVQLSDKGYSIQVEGPPGTGKSQTIANIICNALYHGRKALLVCDKKAAIYQVEKRLSECGLKPAILNLHEEDLDKREFLKQATDKFTDISNNSNRIPVYPFNQLSETRKILNERVNFGRAIAHPSLQVEKRQALAGLIQLRKELNNVPNVNIANWQSLSGDRLARLLRILDGWPELDIVLKDQFSIWNKIRPEAFIDNPNAINEIEQIITKLSVQLGKLDELRELTASIGIELTLESDEDIIKILEIVNTVIAKPKCHPSIIGNEERNYSELKKLSFEWNKREVLLTQRHPVKLTEIYPAEVKHEAEELLAIESASSWQDLSERHTYHTSRLMELTNYQNSYLHICDRIGLVYSPFLNIRLAQLRAVVDLGKLGLLIPHDWWNSTIYPTIMVDRWLSDMRACISHSETAPLPLHFIALEHISSTHCKYIQAMAEHGYNFSSYCLRYVDQRKCKFALRQAYPGIPNRDFKQWSEVTLHAFNALLILKSLRESAEIHFVLRELTGNYLSIAHETIESEKQFLKHENVKSITKTASIVEQWRKRTDIFDIANVNWQLYWESPNQTIVSDIELLLSNPDGIVIQENFSGNIEDEISYHNVQSHRIHSFLKTYETVEGDRTQSVLAAIDAQKEFYYCEEQLKLLCKYLPLQDDQQLIPDWPWLFKVIIWRDKFRELCGIQKLDIDSYLWAQLLNDIQIHNTVMSESYALLEGFFDDNISKRYDYNTLMYTLSDIQSGLSNHHLWLEKTNWQKKISAYPELLEFWDKLTTGNVIPSHINRLFCFNLLRQCDPIAKPNGILS